MLNNYVYFIKKYLIGLLVLYVGSFIKSDAMYAAYGLVDAATAQANCITDLAWVNILMGNATTNFVQSPLAYDPSLPLLDPTNPISPTCAYDSVDCDTPMRLEGIPLGGVSLARDSKKWSK